MSISIPWLDRNTPFPSVSSALREPSGLLAAGGDLSTDRLIDAYSHGIFPWFSEGEPILWWSPDPRMVLYPAELRLHRSLAKRLRRGDYRVTCDTCFDTVMRACAAPRDGQPGTWITERMVEAYVRLHKAGYAHSVEVWMDGELAGGLYGVALGRAFFGESMFSRRSDASKIALAHLARYLEAERYAIIDCQMSTPHLASLGAREISRAEFCEGLKAWTGQAGAPGRWNTEAMGKPDRTS